ncbi:MULTISPECIES: hypothetical protein [Pseudoxanthomonas]|uniref:Uncharacterized protein n=1 Tax=Pseudoxanthomonas winnipegensis TaxID=2480810 RepID=A0AAW8G8E4_9GAMM|nr:MULTISPECIES: hypothetical protein [Pseudoxanthomonas]MDQ1117986.1 hypothetical protein [Pseudoxanthomonas winnipegensis]MDQ1134956.1 hypothetical protein [Pseudoxanthomonas winnipegensis]MDR6138811.1 hypothetical protein [Pseudoxanthomonas sp. SORGH_AS_0997]
MQALADQRKSQSRQKPGVELAGKPFRSHKSAPSLAKQGRAGEGLAFEVAAAFAIACNKK